MAKSINTRCATCTYYEEPLTEAPCLKCYPKDHKPSWKLKRCCATCRHADVHVLEHPCKECFTIGGTTGQVYTNWEGKSND